MSSVLNIGGGEGGVAPCLSEEEDKVLNKDYEKPEPSPATEENRLEAQERIEIESKQERALKIKEEELSKPTWSAIGKTAVGVDDKLLILLKHASSQKEKSSYIKELFKNATTAAIKEGNSFEEKGLPTELLRPLLAAFLHRIPLSELLEGIDLSGNKALLDRLSTDLETFIHRDMSEEKVIRLQLKESLSADQEYALLIRLLPFLIKELASEEESDEKLLNELKTLQIHTLLLVGDRLVQSDAVAALEGNGAIHEKVLRCLSCALADPAISKEKELLTLFKHHAFPGVSPADDQMVALSKELFCEQYKRYQGGEQDGEIIRQMQNVVSQLIHYSDKEKAMAFVNETVGKELAECLSLNINKFRALSTTEDQRLRAQLGLQERADKKMELVQKIVEKRIEGKEDQKQIIEAVIQLIHYSLMLQGVSYEQAKELVNQWIPEELTLKLRTSVSEEDSLKVRLEALNDRPALNEKAFSLLSELYAIKFKEWSAHESDMALKAECLQIHVALDRCAREIDLGPRAFAVFKKSLVESEKVQGFLELSSEIKEEVLRNWIGVPVSEEKSKEMRDIVKYLDKQGSSEAIKNILKNSVGLYFLSYSSDSDSNWSFFLPFFQKYGELQFLRPYIERGLEKLPPKDRAFDWIKLLCAGISKACSDEDAAAYAKEARELVKTHFGLYLSTIRGLSDQEKQVEAWIEQAQSKRVA